MIFCTLVLEDPKYKPQAWECTGFYKTAMYFGGSFCCLELDNQGLVTPVNLQIRELRPEIVVFIC